MHHTGILPSIIQQTTLLPPIATISIRQKATVQINQGSRAMAIGRDPDPTQVTVSQYPDDVIRVAATVRQLALSEQFPTGTQHSAAAAILASRRRKIVMSV